MGTPASASIDHLAHTWRSIIELCEGLTEEEWKRPTGCPGWSVQDNVAHLIDYEAGALGRPKPEHEVGELAHVKNALGASNEVGIDARRSRTGAEVLEELREVTAARHEQLLRLTVDDLAREVTTPAGPGSLQDMLTLRVMDTWSHEQDIRRAVGRPGHDRGPAVTETVTYFLRFLPFVVGKRTGAADGATVAVDVRDVASAAVEVVGGRGQALADVPADPTVRLSMSATTFDAIACGRTDAPDDVDLTGDEALGRAILAGLALMP